MDKKKEMTWQEQVEAASKIVAEVHSLSDGLSEQIHILRLALTMLLPLNNVAIHIC